MKTAIAVLFTLIVQITSAAAAAGKVDLSANHYLAACRDFASSRAIDRDTFTQGECFGAVSTAVEIAPLLEPNFQTCIPNEVTASQSVAVVVHWLDRHPERWQQPFVFLALLALHEAWPCK